MTLENRMVIGDYFDEQPPRNYDHYDPAVEENWEFAQYAQPGCTSDLTRILLESRGQMHLEGLHV